MSSTKSMKTWLSQLTLLPSIRGTKACNSVFLKISENIDLTNLPQINPYVWMKVQLWFLQRAFTKLVETNKRLALPVCNSVKVLTRNSLINLLQPPNLWEAQEIIRIWIMIRDTKLACKKTVSTKTCTLISLLNQSLLVTSQRKNPVIHRPKTSYRWTLLFMIAISALFYESEL